MQSFENPISKKIQVIIEEEENIKWQIKKIEVRLTNETQELDMLDKIKHEQLLLEQRLYQNKLVNLHSQRMKLHEELSRMVSEQDTPMNTYAQSNYDIQASFFRTTQQMGEKDNIATEQQALAKAEAARMLLEKAIDR